MLPRVAILDTGLVLVQKVYRGHRNKTFVPLNGGGCQQPAIKVFKFRAKISLRKLLVVYALREYKRRKEIFFYLFCVDERRGE